MRRQLILTVSAVVSIVLLALLIPMAVLVRNYAVEDRLSRAALEVQATETVVSRRDKGEVSVYLTERNARDHSMETTVLYPDGTVVGPGPGEDALVRAARTTGRARVDDVRGGSQILVPVSLGASGPTGPSPVVRVVIREAGVAGEVHRAWVMLAALGVLMLLGALVLADRLGRSFVRPIRALADSADHLGEGPLDGRAAVDGPPEVRSAARALNQLISRVQHLLARERDQTAELSHRLRTPITALRLGIDGLVGPRERRRLTEDVDRLEEIVDRMLTRAGRASHEELVVRANATAIVAERGRFWEALGSEQGRSFTVTVPGSPLWVGVSTTALEDVLDILLDNVFSHTPDGAAVTVTLRPDGELLVEDAGPGLPDHVDPLRRGESGAGSSGLGLSIAAQTARDGGGSLTLGRSALGGAAVRVELGPGDTWSTGPSRAAISHG